MKYYIDYNTGAGNEIVEGSLECAKLVADVGIAYTQIDIAIRDYERYFSENNDSDAIVAYRRWVGIALDEDNDDVDECVAYGNCGYYSPWIEV